MRRLGAEVLKNPAPLAYANALAASVYDCGLRLEADDEPPRHADIVGWPERKDRQKLGARALPTGARGIEEGGDPGFEHFRNSWCCGTDGMLWIVKPESVREIGCIHTC